MSAPPSAARKALPLLALTLIGPLAPLAWHRSPTPWLAGYGKGYLLGIACLAGCALVTTLATATACRRRNSLRPAIAVLLPVWAIFLSLIAGEIILRWIAPHPFAFYRTLGNRRSLLFGFEQERNFEWRYVGATYHTDSLGFRRNSLTPDWSAKPATPPPSGSPPPPPRIFTLGESSVLGYGLNDDQTWTHRLQEALQARQAPAVVVNGGNNGHNTLQSFLRLKLRILPHKPDYVLTYLAYNEVSRHYLEPDALALQDPIAFSNTLPQYVGFRNAGQNLYCRTLLYHHITHSTPERLRKNPRFRALFGIPNPDLYSIAETDIPRLIEHNGGRLRENMLSMVDACHRHGAVLVPVTFLCDTRRMDPYVVKAIAHYNDVVRTLARQEGLPLVDLAARFESVGDGEAYFFEDHYHPSVKGAAWIGQSIADAYPDWGVKPSTKIP